MVDRSTSSDKGDGLIVARPRLFALLERRSGGAIWLHGPTGCGKTVLIRSYLRSVGRDGRWITLDARHRSLAALFQDLSNEYGQGALPVYSGEQGGTPQDFAVRFFQQLDRRLGDDEALIFDDAQWLSADAVAVIGSAIEVLAGRRTVIIASHLYPDAQLVPHVAASQLFLIGHVALAFDADEAASLAQEVGSSAQAVDRIREQTSGWAAGLMLALQFASSSATEGPLPLAELIRRRVLRGTPERELRCLRLLAELTEVPASIVEAGKEWQAACAQLERLARRGLFVARTGTPGSAFAGAPTWTLHDLLRTAVKETLPIEQCRGDVADSLIRYFARREWIDPGWQLAAAIGPEALTDAVLLHGSIALRHAGRPSLRALVKPRISDTSPEVAFWYARASLGEDDASALAACAVAFDGFAERGEAAAQGLVVALALLTCFAMGESATFPLEWFDRFHELSLSPDRLQSGEDRALLLAGVIAEPELRGRATLSLDCVDLLQDQLLEQVLASRLSHNENVLAGCAIAARLADLGRTHEHAVFAARLEQTPSFAFGTPQVRALWQIEHAYALMTADPGGARESFLTLLRLADQHVLARRKIDAYIGLCRVALSNSRMDEARRYFATLQEERAHISPVQAIWILHLRSRLAMTINDLKTAEDLLESATAAMRSLEPTSATPDVFLMDLIQLLYLKGEVEASLALARRCASEQQQIDLNRFSVAADLLESLSTWSLDQTKSTALLSRALTNAARLDFPAFLRHMPVPASTLMQRAIRHGIELAFVARVVRSRCLPAPADADGTWPWAIRVQLLGSFRLSLDGEVVGSQGKAAQKPLELLKFLASLDGTCASFAVVADALWPFGDNGSERKNVESTVARLRKILGRDEALLVAGSSVTLSPSLVWSDLEHLRAVLRTAESLPMAADIAEVVDVAERLSLIYRGDVLQGDLHLSWAVGVREKTRRAFTRAAQAILTRLLEAGELRYVCDLAESCIQSEPLAEYFYQVLIQVYVRLDQHADALRIYRHCEKMLSVMAAMQPNAETRRCRALIRGSSTQGEK